MIYLGKHNRFDVQEITRILVLQPIDNFPCQQGRYDEKKGCPFKVQGLF